MKRKLPFLTKLAVFLLVLSCLGQIGYLAWLFYQTAQIKDSSALLKGFLDIFGVEMYMLVGSVAAPLFFSSLFKKQARQELAGEVTDIVILLAIIVFDHQDVLRRVFETHAAGTADLLDLVLGVVVPVIILLSILLGSKPLAFCSAIGAAAMTVYNLGVIRTLYGVMGDQAVGAMAICEIVYGAGMILGLLGVRKGGKDPTEKQADA